MRAIVTGGAGFIGSCVVRHLAQAGADVLVLDKLTYAGNLSSLKEVAESPRFAFKQLDICDGAAIAAAVQGFAPDTIFHLAAESHVDRSIEGAGMFVETNVTGTYHVLEAARGYWRNLPVGAREAFRLVHVSTDEVYGSLGDDGFFTEETPYNPRSPYSASKASSDHLASAWFHTYGLPVITSNCSNNYGPYQLPEKLIPLTILNGLEGAPLPVYGDGLNKRDWLYVEDHARALILIAGKGRPGETYNVGGRNERTNLEVVHRICDLLDSITPADSSRRDLIQFVKDRPGHDRRYAIDATKLETELGWLALENFDRGIEHTIRWYLANRWWWEPLRAAGHGKSRLGLAGA